MEPPVVDQFNSLWRLLDPAHKAQVNRWIETPKGLEKLHEHLRHRLLPNPEYSIRPEHGQREARGLLMSLRRLGAGPTCLLISSDDLELTGIVTLDEDLLQDRAGRFFHGTIFSCIPGRLALFQQAQPGHTVIVHRP